MSDLRKAFFHGSGTGPHGDRFESSPATAGPWSSRAQHGGPPAALLGRALEGLEELETPEPRTVGRFTMELLGPVPVGPLAVTASVVRPGRSVSLREAVLYDEQAGRPCARAQAWAFPVGEGPGELGPPLPHGPWHGHDEEPPASWSRGYLDSVEWRWIEGAVTRPGPAVVWMRQRIPLLAGEQPSALQRVLCCVDSASGVSAALDPAAWDFLNTELTVHLLRPQQGEWSCLVAETILGPGRVGMAVSQVYDEVGLVARSAQALLVTPARA